MKKTSRLLSLLLSATLAVSLSAPALLVKPVFQPRGKVFRREGQRPAAVPVVGQIPHIGHTHRGRQPQGGHVGGSSLGQRLRRKSHHPAQGDSIRYITSAVTSRVKGPSRVNQLFSPVANKGYVTLAAEKGVAKGVGGDRFDPSGVCGARDFITMLYRLTHLTEGTDYSWATALE